MRRTIETRVDVIRNGAVLTQLLPDGAPRIRMRSGAAIKTSFSGSFAPNDKVDWLRDELRPVLILDGVEHPLGVYAPATVRPSCSNGVRRVRVDAYDRCWRVQSSRSDSLVHLAAGTNYIDACKSLLAQSGIALVLATPTASTLREAREDWEVGESTLTIVNQLLAEINYGPLWFNSQGYAVLSPRREVSAENISGTYDAGSIRSLMMDEVSASMDLYNAPNVFICVCSLPDQVLVATAENNNGASPLSIVRRGRRIAKTYKVRNIASQADLEEYARLLCQDAALLGSTVTIQTALQPPAAPGDIVALVHPEMEGLCRETEWQMELKPGGTMTHKMEKVVMSL